MSEPNSNPAVSAAAVASGNQEGRQLTRGTQMDLMMLRLVRSMPNCFLRKSRTNEEAALLLSQSGRRFAGLKRKGLWIGFISRSRSIRVVRPPVYESRGVTRITFLYFAWISATSMVSSSNTEVRCERSAKQKFSEFRSAFSYGGTTKMNNEFRCAKPLSFQQNGLVPFVITQQNKVHDVSLECSTKQCSAVCALVRIVANEYKHS